MPDWSDSTVFLAITDRGRSSSTLRSWAPRRPRASREISMPGAIAPPTYSPRTLTTSNVVAVPKSTTIAGPPNSCEAASALMIRSVPTSRGLSMRTGTPVRTPGSTMTSGTSPWYVRSMSRHSCSTDGTVAHTDTPRSALPTGESLSRPLSSTPHSSAVRRSSVASRQWSTTSPRSRSPMVVWLLPMSAHSSGVMTGSRPEVHGHVEHRGGVRQRADGDEVNPGGRHLTGPLQGQPAGGLQAGPARGDPHGLGHLRGAHVVEEDVGGAGIEQLPELVERGHLDLHRQVRVARPH